MAVFTYRASAVDSRGAGAPLRGTITADSPRQARETLRARGLKVRDLSEVTAASALRAPGALWSVRMPSFSFRRRPEGKVVEFCRELGTLLSAGIPLLQSLDSIAKSQKGTFLQSVLLLRDRIASGASLAEALRSQPQVFDTITVSMVEVGERSGTLDQVLEQLASFKGRAHQLRGRLATALIYPAIVVAASVAITIFLMTFVVPQLLEALIETGQPLPLPTRIVKAISDALVGYWWLLLLVIGAAAAGGWAALRQERVRRAWHRVQLKIPLIGPLIRKQAIVRICVALATMTRSGVEFVQAVRIVRQAMSNLVMREALERCEDAVHAGRDIAPALESTGAFPPTVVQIVDVGQSSGRLDSMLERLAVDYDAQVATATQRLVAVLEPALILVLATVVMFIVLSIILPYMEIGNVL